MSAADAALEPLLAPILAAGRDGRTLVVLTSDHGESLGEHGEATHGVFAYEAALKVPLIVYQPRLVPTAVIDTPAQHIDLLPTILDAVAHRIAVRTPRKEPAAGHGGHRARRAADRHLLRSTVGSAEPALGAARRDRGRLDEVHRAADSRVVRPEGRSARAQQPCVVCNPPASQELRSRLQQLRGPRASRRRRVSSPPRRASGCGALDTSPAVRPATRARFTEADDPKRLIGFDARLQEIVGQYLAGDLQGALARCRALLRERPDMPLTLFHLAQLERENGNLDGAIDALRKAVAIVPDNSETVAMLGAYLTQAGRPAEAVALLDPFARRENADVEVLTARAHRAGEAAAVRRSACGRCRGLATRTRPMDGCSSRWARSISWPGNRDRAREAWNSALALNPNLARAHTSLGILSLEDRRPAEAVEHWKAATRHRSTRIPHDTGHRAVAREERAKRPRRGRLSSSSWLTRRRRGLAARSIERAPFSRPSSSA